jgi:hypothetical protein
VVLTPPYVLSKSSHGTLELGPLAVQHVPNMIIHLSLVAFGPAVQGGTLWQHGVTGIAQLRVDGSDGGQGSCRARTLCPAESRWGPLLFILSCSCSAQDALNLLETLCLAVAAPQFVCRSAVEPRQVGNEEAVLDVGEGCQGRNLGVCPC